MWKNPSLAFWEGLFSLELVCHVYCVLITNFPLSVTQLTQMYITCWQFACRTCRLDLYQSHKISSGWTEKVH